VGYYFKRQRIVKKFVAEKVVRPWPDRRLRPCMVPSDFGDTAITRVRAYSKMVKKGKVFPYSLPSVGPGADPGVQAVSPQVT